MTSTPQSAPAGTQPGPSKPPQWPSTTDGTEPPHDHQDGPPPITWINRGRQNCKGNVMTLRDPDGTLWRTTCESCPLEWTTPVQA